MGRAGAGPAWLPSPQGTSPGLDAGDLTDDCNDGFDPGFEATRGPFELTLATPRVSAAH